MLDGTVAENAGDAVRSQIKNLITDESQKTGNTKMVYTINNDEIEVPDMNDFYELKSDLTDVRSNMVNIGNLITNINNGGYYAGGTFVINNEFSYTDFIEIEPNEIYTSNVVGSTGFFSIFDSNKNIISFDNKVLWKDISLQVYDKNDTPLSTRRFIKMPSNAKYCVISTNTTNIQNIWLYSGYAVNNIDMKPVYIPKTENDIKTYNYLNQKNCIYGYYIPSLTTHTYARVNNGRVSDYIPILEDGYLYKINGGVPLLVFDSDKNVIQGYTSVTEFNNRTDLPIGASFIKIYWDANNNNPIYAKGKWYRGWIDEINLEYGETPNSISITYNANEVNQLALALYKSYFRGDLQSIPLNIYLERGDYDFKSANDAINDVNYVKYGHTIGSNTKLIGKGSARECVIHSRFSDDETSEKANLYSTLNVNVDEIVLENITVIAKNCRYAIHMDTNNQITGINTSFKNCIFINEGNNTGLWNYPSSVGFGTSENSKYLFEECNFISYNYTSTGIHSNNGEVFDSEVIYNKCKFLNNNASTNDIDFSIDEYNATSNGIIHVIMTNCYFLNKKMSYRYVGKDSVDKNDFEVDVFSTNGFNLINYNHDKTPNVNKLYE